MVMGRVRDGWGVKTFSVSGSPADNDNLEVGDEILEVNGKTLEDACHAEVISHIHQVSRGTWGLCHTSLLWPLRVAGS